MENTVLYITAFIVFITILVGSVIIVHLVYSKVYDKVKEELEAKYSELFDKKLEEAIEREEAKLKGQHALDYIMENNLNKKMSAKEFMEWRCMLTVRRGQESFKEQDRGGVIKEGIPSKLPAFNRMLRSIALQDNVAGAVIDLYVNSMWEDYKVKGVKNKYVKDFYNKAIPELFTKKLLQDITEQVLILGRFCAAKWFDAKKGYWTRVLPLDPDFLEILPVPVNGSDPILNYIVSPAMAQAFYSNDDRFKPYKKHFSFITKDYLKNNKVIPLNPDNVVWVTRKVSPLDNVGTSFLTRILPYYNKEGFIEEKMIALGVDSECLKGNFNKAFEKSLYSIRDTIVEQTIMRYAEQLARHYNLVKGREYTDKDDVFSESLSAEDAKNIDKSKLLLPTTVTFKK